VDSSQTLSSKVGIAVIACTHHECNAAL
jgi:hypothetical protein